MKRLVLAAMAALAAVASGISLEEIETLAVAGKIYSADDLLGRLSDDERTHYVLMTKSRSLQEASEESPRVIVFGSRAELLIAFNGGREQRGYDSIEILALDRKAQAWQARSLALDPEESRPASLSGPNPSRCLQCHGTPVRPLWEPYPYWPGASTPGDQLTDAEERWHDSFGRRSETRPRYRSLLWRDNLRVMREHTLRFTHAFSLHTRIESLESARLASWLRSQPAFGPLRFALAGALADCEDLVDWAPPSPGAGAAAWRELHEDTVRKNNKAPAPQQRLLDEGEHRIFTHLRYLLETRSYSLRTWSRSIAHPYLFTTNAGVLMRNVLSELRGQDEEVGSVEWDYPALLRHYDRFTFTNLYTAAHRDGMARYCRELAVRQFADR